MAPITRLAAAALLFSFVFVNAAPVLDPNANRAFSTDGAYGNSPVAQTLKKRAARYSQVYTCKTPGTIAITFDDGPYKYTRQLLKELDDIPEKPKVTFFVNGHNNGEIKDYADVVADAFKAGHQIGSHTWDHEDLNKLSLTAREDEMKKLDDALKEILPGKVRPTFMRPPYGNADDEVLNFLGDAGYTIINWNIDTMDWAHPTDVPKSMKEYTKALDASGAIKKSFIGLEHDPNEKTSTELGPQAVKYAISKGFKVVTVGTCLEIPESKWYRS
ncbi:hypothetical protein BGZ59_005331 [Podila verticillata]|nr:hypothetical protein BGZ59_005331 [Podila verticillata]KFH70368.1 hypothetical protein MVEG_03219 [Podila verticillata NRRL 6337]